MIPTKREPIGWSRGSWEMERCCFCRQPTPYWTTLPDRTPGQQVACCETCAPIRNPEEVPSKAVWCGLEREIRKRETRR